MPAIKDPIMLDLPDGYETERLIVRPPGLGEGDIVHAGIQASRSELLPYMAWANQSRAETETWLRNAVAKWIRREDLAFMIWRKADGAFLGGTSLHSIEWQVPAMEIGYWQVTQYTGNGYITEAVRGLVDFARQYLGALRLEIWCDVRNLRSAAVAERLEFKRYSHVVNADRNIAGQLIDLYGFCMTWAEQE
jgi:RimJ/RimL family protein N-acetyltransferase